MINRVSNTQANSMAMNALINGDGEMNNIRSESEELSKLTRDELLSLLMFGASHVLKTTDQDHDADADESIEEDIEIVMFFYYEFYVLHL